MSDDTSRDIARASAWMALGTVVSRLTGFLRIGLLVIVIGQSLNADIFDTANTIPNSLYILVAGGIFNVVLVPQLVRAMKNDADGGDAYAQRVITLGLLVLAVATVLLLVAVPWLMHLVFDGKLFTPGFAVQHDSARLLMWLCMPQVLFYGAFVLIGQVLNARGRFGPMMWAPIINNVIACVVLGGYALAFGTSNGTDGFTTSEAWLLGAGSTAAIAAQTLVLIPYLRQTGFSYRARFDFRGVGLGHTLRLGFWTLCFIVANQIALIVIYRLGTAATLEGAERNIPAAGATVYSFGFLVSQVPHGVITVSLATALMPTLAALSAGGEYARVRVEVARTIRLALTIVVPLAIACACLGVELATAAGVAGALEGDTELIGHTIQAFSLGMIAFTVHYLVLRGFYADENTKTPFVIQVVIAAVTIGAGIVLTQRVEPSMVAPVLALTFGLAYSVGAATSTIILSRKMGPLVDAEMVRFIVRLVIAGAIAAAVMRGAAWLLESAGLDPSRASGGLPIAVIGGGLGFLAYLAAAHLMRMEQIRYMADTLRRRA